MPGMSLEFSLGQAALALLTILGILVGAGLFMGLLTLPIFFASMFYKNLWFWAAEERTGKILRRSFAQAVWTGFPAISLFSTVITFGYFGVFDIFEKLPLGKKGTTQTLFEGKYDDLTRKAGEKIIWRYPEGTAVEWKRDPVGGHAMLVMDEGATPEIIDGLSVPATMKPETPEEEADRKSQLKAAQAKARVRDQELKKIIRQQQAGIYAPPPEGDHTELSKEQLRRLDGMVSLVVESQSSMQLSIIQLIRGVGIFFMLIIGPFPLLVFGFSFIFGRRGMTMILRSLGRNLLRTSLTYLAIFVLVWVVTCVWSVLDFLDKLTQEKDANMKGLITEKYQIPSQMKPSHLNTIKSMLEELPEGQKPENIEDNLMTWAFVGGTLDPSKRTPMNSLFFFCTEPEKVIKMMPGLEDLTAEQFKMLEEACKMMGQNPRAVVIGHAKLVQMNKRVGDRIQVTSLNYKDLVFDFEIVAEFPAGTRWDQSAAMSRKYLDNALSEYEGKNGKAHPLADKCMNLIWIRLPNKAVFESFSERLNTSGRFTPAVKMEIESSAYANFLSPYKDLIRFLRYALAPGLLAVTTLVISLVISIGVRERRVEMAVLKVLGFRPWMVMALVLGEALLLGSLSGFLATATAYSLVNAMGGIPLPIGFFGKFFVPASALWWGPAIGTITSALGTIMPAWSARKIKVSEVFSRVA
ncbi:ABC transporter permease [Zavarzinella formosa]|uniref:ABC transporter permease n=1 Tax=Zavarzinella formosa TaxID=360055 RepID=UPI00030F69BF|nr:ABC transporter permease [Zavarzinella formosa]